MLMQQGKNCHEYCLPYFTFIFTLPLFEKFLNKTVFVSKGKKLHNNIVYKQNLKK